MEPATEATDTGTRRVPSASLAPQLTETPKADLPWDVPTLQRAVVRMHSYEILERPWHQELGVTEGTVRDALTPAGFDPARVRRYVQVAKSMTSGRVVPRHEHVEDVTRTLRGFITSMAPYAEVRAMALEPGGAEWRRCREAVDRAQRLSVVGVVGGLRAATDHANVLASAVTDLLAHAERYAQEAPSDG
ncbi:DUF6415 family natural product biosynthesis protein [Streptantibioticus parmotrematis]|uniref:DUF6415 family natural product biosynthesis protein n=1 Tax=Streptantibioticus parmotrematis TaxID=2873249 RepID=UPI0033E679FC